LKKKTNKKDFAILRCIIDTTDSPYVTKERWESFLYAFGPLRGYTEKLRPILTAKWWAGYVSPYEAECLLYLQPQGHYLVSVSSVPGTIAVAYVSAPKEVKLMQVTSSPEGYSIVNTNAKYASMDQLIQSQSYLKEPLEVKFISEGLHFMGALETSNAENLLQQCQDKTYLTRLSTSQKGKIVFSCKYKSRIYHELVQQLPGGKYQCRGTTVFDSLDDYLKTNAHSLQFPFLVDSEKLDDFLPPFSKQYCMTYAHQ